MLREYKENSETIVMILGNKSDMEEHRQVETQIGIDFAKRQ